MQCRVGSWNGDMMDGARVLLIIENWGTLKLLSDLFVAIGARVSATSSGKQGLCRYHLLHPDLVVMDLKLGDSDGRQLYMQMRSVSDAKVIILTALGEEYRSAWGQGLNGVDCIVKPFNFDDLMARAAA
jgi:DNA-binding response OmpR family regulator